MLKNSFQISDEGQYFFSKNSISDNHKFFGGLTENEFSSKIKYSWQIVSSVSQLAPAQACVKRYLDEQVGSPFAEVHPEFWHTAIMLPVQRFVGARKERVWTESRKFR